MLRQDRVSSEGGAMTATSLHHIALACKDPVETHRFYHDVLGLTLVHTESQAGPKGERVTHFFYDLGDGSLLAFFDLHGVGEPDGFDPAISTGLGLPIWVNHFALRRDIGELPAIKERMGGFGIEPTMEADHGWCTSLYYTDPNGILIEFCADTPGVEANEAEAERALFDATGRSRDPRPDRYPDPLAEDHLYDHLDMPSTPSRMCSPRAACRSVTTSARPEASAPRSRSHRTRHRRVCDLARPDRVERHDPAPPRLTRGPVAAGRVRDGEHCGARAVGRPAVGPAPVNGRPADPPPILDTMGMYVREDDSSCVLAGVHTGVVGPQDRLHGGAQQLMAEAASLARRRESRGHRPCGHRRPLDPVHALPRSIGRSAPRHPPWCHWATTTCCVARSRRHRQRRSPRLDLHDPGAGHRLIGTSQAARARTLAAVRAHVSWREEVEHDADEDVTVLAVTVMGGEAEWPPSPVVPSYLAKIARATRSGRSASARWSAPPWCRFRCSCTPGLVTTTSASVHPHNRGRSERAPRRYRARVGGVLVGLVLAGACWACWSSDTRRGGASASSARGR